MGGIARLALVVGVIAVILGLGYLAYTSFQGEELPAAGVDPDYRSSTFREVFVGVDEDTNYVSIVSADTSDRMIQVTFDRNDLLGWTGSDSHWTPIDSPADLYPNSPADDETHGALLDIASGLTIDDVIPQGARDYTTLIATQDTTMLERSVTRYTTQVDVASLQRDAPGVMRQFEEFWGPTEAEVGAPSAAPLNVTVWADSDGVVYQVESKSDYTASIYRLTFIEVSDTEPFTPAFPDEGR